MQNTHGLPMSFDGRQQSFTSSQGGYGQPVMYAQAQQSFTQHRSFSDLNGHSQQPTMGAPQIYTAVYSGVSVYEMEVNGVAVMRRRSDSWLNATQILKVAGVDKGKRTKVLEKEILTGEHEKVQGGYGKYQGTWINYRRGREFCRQYGVEEILRPLLDYDMSSDGSGQPGQGVDTPTKEQAMAANRKRFYTQNLDGRQNPTSASGTFFSNISSTASNALAAMNKAARLNSPAPRPTSAAQRRASNIQQQRSSQQNLGSQESFRGGSQQSVPGLSSERSFGAASDSAYATQNAYPEGPSDSQEPPRKRIKARSPSDSFSHSQPNGAEISMREGTPTEPNESFLYHQPLQHSLADGELHHTVLPPLPRSGDRNTEEKQALILDMFHDLSRTDYTNHLAITRLSGSDLDIPLDQSCNTALHWAATLARVSLMRLLISRGASIYRGNAAGETPLMAAVMVNNNLDFNCFPELLEILSPLIEVRDNKRRTILHHISSACGIKGRASSSKYYLECLLEFLVRSNTSMMMASQQDHGSIPKTIGLMRFMSEMVNARDTEGNTALCIVAKIGNRSIIQQLLEVQADPMIPNHKGFTAAAFLGEADGPSRSEMQAMESPGKRAISRIFEISNEIVPALSASLGETHNQFTAEIKIIQDRIDAHTAQVRELSATQKTLQEQFEGMQSRMRARQERKQKILNLRRAVKEMRERRKTPSSSEGLKLGDADKEFVPPASALQEGAPPQHQQVGSEAERRQLQSRLQAYHSLNARLNAHLTQLRARDGELETKYRRVIALCTGTREDLVDEVLPQLVLAVESEGDPGQGVGGQDVGRVREFLRRVEMVV